MASASGDGRRRGANRSGQVAQSRLHVSPIAMPAVQSKADVVRVVQALPDEASLDDVIERLVLLRKVNIGLAQHGEGVPQAEVEAEFRKARAERSWNRG